MSKKHVDDILDELSAQNVPIPDGRKKQRVINSAVASFKEEFDQKSADQPAQTAIESDSDLQEKFNSQGIDESHRLRDKRDRSHKGSVFSELINSIRRQMMNLTNNRIAYNAFGTVAIAFVAVSMVFVMPSMQTDTSPQEIIVTNRQPLEESIVVGGKKQNEQFPTDSDIGEEAMVASRPVVTNESDDLAALVAEIAKTPGTIPTSQERSVDSNAVLSDGPGDSESEFRDQITKNVNVVQSSGPVTQNKPAAKLESKLKSDDLARVQEFSRERSENQLQALGTGSHTKASSNKIPERQNLQEIVVTGSRVADSRIVAASPRAEAAPASPSYGAGLSKPATLAPTDNIAFPYGGSRLDEAEEYAEYQTNTIKQVADEPVSTFSIDVDTASYSLVRNQLNAGRLPKPQAVRAEELINYFDYNYPTASSKKQPFEPSVNVLPSPWNAERKLVHIAIKGYDIPATKQPDSNIVFLLDVSGSMSSANKLPLVKQSVSLLLESLKPSDTVSIVVYAGAAGTVLEPTKVSEKSNIMQALQRLSAGGSTAGGAGISLAYQLAEQNFNKNGVNRIILATDGDFNVGLRSNEDLKTLVERKRESGIFLSVLGFGRNNYQDDMMQTLAQNGNGVAAYIDTLSEAKKVLVDEATSTLFPIAKDVKIQVEFNPEAVSEYRLVGYETRHLNREDFNNDKVDAGDIGAGHTVTAIYEITPATAEHKSVDEPRYVGNKVATQAGSKDSSEYGFLKLRYKLPESNTSKLIEKAIPVSANKLEPELAQEVSFSVAVAGFAQLLTNSKYTGGLNFDDVIKLASANKGADNYGYRSEFIQLARMAKVAQP